MSRFVFYRPDQAWIPVEFQPCLLVTDMFDVPVPSRVAWETDHLVVDLLEAEAGRVHSMVKTAHDGGVLLSTPWLLPRNKPYRLELELLRGILARLRRGLEIWHTANLPLPADFAPSMTDLTGQFICGWRQQHAATAAQQLLPMLYRGLELLSRLPAALVQIQGRDPFGTTETGPLPCDPAVDTVLEDQAPSATEQRSEQQAAVGQGSPNGSSSAAQRAHSPLFGIGLHLDVRNPSERPRNQAEVSSHGSDPRPLAASSQADQPAGRPEPQPVAADRPISAATADLNCLVESERLSWIEVGADWQDLNQIGINQSSDDLGQMPNWATGLRRPERRVMLGPLFQIGAGCVPQSVGIGPDGQALIQAVQTSLRQTLPTLLSEVDMLHVVGGIDGIGVAGLTPTLQYQVTANLLETAAGLAPYTPLLISFSQPLAERLAWSVGGQHPDQLLGKLAKERIPLHAIGLELDLGYFPFGTLPRDPLQWVLNLQRWTAWGVPLYLFVRVPSRPDVGGRRLCFDPSGRHQPSPSNQQAAIFEFAQLVSALPWIHGLIYNQWQDRDQRFGDAGLVDLHGQAKPLLQQWLGRPPSLQRQPVVARQPQ